MIGWNGIFSGHIVNIKGHENNFILFISQEHKPTVFGIDKMQNNVSTNEHKMKKNNNNKKKLHEFYL